MKIKLSDGNDYEVEFDTKDTCFEGIKSWRSVGSIKEEEVMYLIQNSNLFIRLSYGGIPKKIIMVPSPAGSERSSAPILDIPISDFSMIESGSGLIVCDDKGESRFSLAIDQYDPDGKVYVCSLYDTQCL